MLPVVVLDVVDASVRLVQLASDGVPPERVFVPVEPHIDRRKDFKRAGRVEEEQDGKHGKQ